MDDSVPWHGDYHGDVNIQQTYWPIFASNHIELGEPYFKTFYEMLPTVKLQTDEEGKYYIYPSNSPEQGDWWVKNPTIDIALIKELFIGIIKASEILGVDSEERATWKEESAQVRDITENRILMVTHSAVPSLAQAFREDILSFETVKEDVYVIERSSKSFESFKADILKGEERKEPRKYVGPKYLATTDIGEGSTTYLGKPMDWNPPLSGGEIT